MTTMRSPLRRGLHPRGRRGAARRGYYYHCYTDMLSLMLIIYR